MKEKTVKITCDVCDVEILDKMKLSGFNHGRVELYIEIKLDGGEADLCEKCTKKLLRDMVREIDA